MVKVGSCEEASEGTLVDEFGLIELSEVSCTTGAAFGSGVQPIAAQRPKND